MAKGAVLSLPGEGDVFESVDELRIATLAAARMGGFSTHFSLPRQRISCHAEQQGREINGTDCRWHLEFEFQQPSPDLEHVPVRVVALRGSHNHPLKDSPILEISPRLPTLDLIDPGVHGRSTDDSVDADDANVPAIRSLRLHYRSKQSKSQEEPPTPSTSKTTSATSGAASDLGGEMVPLEWVLPLLAGKKLERLCEDVAIVRDVRNGELALHPLREGLVIAGSQERVAAILRAICHIEGVQVHTRMSEEDKIGLRCSRPNQGEHCSWRVSAVLKPPHSFVVNALETTHVGHPPGLPHPERDSLLVPEPMTRSLSVTSPSTPPTSAAPPPPPPVSPAAPGRVAPVKRRWIAYRKPDAQDGESVSKRPRHEPGGQSPGPITSTSLVGALQASVTEPAPL